ncbi:uncharacterized protein HMPREF1541_10436 [Cyphellophora europaea CBS 101466]|uniref:CSC1/OSCA1-like 7TM region domain-containing protein n=1 Tax=Cyphellophora europaea (strain CBS 101466) TaxID=1220924 RepID=W2S7T4_CYPE1|nr:uncharacterized protein HMPREF1541_10436 [Cyphellophora europaea CBS 101466]ETN44766.1 hypothetical protein HMPREF1541_10436 [Cyphellophora europaea CBS 101466]
MHQGVRGRRCEFRLCVSTFELTLARSHPQATGGQRLDPKRKPWPTQLQNLCHRLLGAWPQGTTVIDGIEPFFFDRFLRFQSVLFGSSAIIVTPVVALFNHYFGQAKDDLNPLDRLGWSSLSTTSPEPYWLYVVLTLAFAVFIQVMVGRELEQTLIQRSRLLRERLSDQSVTHFVQVEGLPQEYRDEGGIRDICGQLQSHLNYVVWLPRGDLLIRLSDRRRRCLHAIEHVEARFIARLVRYIREGQTVMLDQELTSRYQQHGSSWTSRWLSPCQSVMPYSCQRVAVLYEALLQLSREHQQAMQEVETCPTAAILALDSYRAAKLLCNFDGPAHDGRINLHYLGTSLSELLVPNIIQFDDRSKLFSEALNLGTILLVILSSVPMGAIGAVSQMNTVLPLLGRVSGLQMPASAIGLIQGALPQILTTILMQMMRGVLRALTNSRCCHSRAEAEITMQTWYFWFLFTQLFVTTSISTGLITIMSKMIKAGLWELPRTLAENLPRSGTYYLAYIPLQTALELASTTIRIPMLLRFYHWRSRWQPPRRVLEDVERRRVGNFLGEVYPFVTVVSVIVIIYALFSPLILPVASLCAVLSRIRFRYAQVYVGKATSPTNGELYLASLHSLFWGLLVMELTFIGLFLLKLASPNLKHDLPQLTTLLLLFYGTFRYRQHAGKKYSTVDPGFEAQGSPYPGDVAHNASTRRVDEELSRTWRGHNQPADDGVVWIAEDSKGVSDALVSFIQTRYSSLSNTVAVITNAHATVDMTGNINLHMAEEHEEKATHR